MNRSPLAPAVAALALSAVACGGGPREVGSAEEPATPETTAAPATPAPTELDDTAQDDTAVVAPLSEHGARHAAAAMASFTTTLLYTPADDVAGLIDSVTTAAGAEALEELLAEEIVPVRDAVHVAEQASEANTWWVVAPLTAKVTAFNGDTGEASVELWAAQVVSREDLVEPEARFYLVDVDLVHDGQRWLLEDWADRPGPAPALGVAHTAASAAELDAQLDDHRLLDSRGDVP